MVFAKLVKAATFGTAAALALTLGTTASMAADKKPAAPAAPAAPAKAADAAQKPADNRPKLGISDWYKICLDVPVPEQTKPGEQPKQQKPEEMKKVNVCITQVDIRDTMIGEIHGKLAVRQAAGQEKAQLLAMLPLRSLLPAGALVKIDDKEPIKLTYQSCDEAGCFAEAIVEPALVATMKTGKQIAYLGMDVAGHALSIPLPLEGFAKAFDGQPIPIEKYNEDQKKIAEIVYKRKVEYAEYVKKAQEEAAKKAAGQTAPAAAAPAKTK